MPNELPIDLDGAGAEYGEVLAATIGRLMLPASRIGAAGLVRDLGSAISRSERDRAFRALDAAFTARATPEEADSPLFVLRVLRGDLATLDAIIDAASDRDAVPSPVDVVGAAAQDGAMREPKIRSGPAWEKYVAWLVEKQKDVEIIEAAIAPAPFAGSQGKLAELSGLSTESISRVKNGRRSTGFSDASRDWMRRYLLDPANPPQAMESKAGPKRKAGAIAPQVFVDEATHATFLEQASKIGGHRVALDFLIRAYIDGLGRRRRIPAPEIPKGPCEIRTRVTPGLLTELEGKVGVDARDAHLRAAVVQGLPKLATRTSAPGFVATHAP